MNTQVKKDLEDALHLINKAAREEKAELKQIIQEKYENVREMFAEKMELGSDAVKNTLADVDKKVKENPWPYVATATVGAFLLGFLLSRSRDR